ncbi:hypothetical protein K439DRAFT_1619880 [Ramaria rubella]|nr:hypothetical protein K439DRAFT_1619880 [Ramaria rubella]
MQFTSALFQVASLLVLVAVHGDAAALSAQASPAVEFCTSNNFQGSCVDIFPSNGNCVTFGANSGFNDAVSSVHVQKGTTCTLFVNNGCSGGSLFIGSDVKALGDFNFNDVASSFKCNA